MRDIDALAAAIDNCDAILADLLAYKREHPTTGGIGARIIAVADSFAQVHARSLALYDQEAALHAGGSLNELRTAVRAAWSAETSADGNWTPANPALGQCAVTALIVQDLMGGRLLRTTVNGTSHYLNELPDGRRVDLTFDQFYDAEPVEREREYVLSFPATASRYDLLRSRL